SQSVLLVYSTPRPIHGKGAPRRRLHGRRIPIITAGRYRQIAHFGQISLAGVHLRVMIGDTLFPLFPLPGVTMLRPNSQRARSAVQRRPNKQAGPTQQKRLLLEELERREAPGDLLGLVGLLLLDSL